MMDFEDAHIFLEQTDSALPKHWHSGSLKYDNFKPLTEGGTAVIKTCLDTNLQRIVAYKTLHPHLKDNDQANRRFLREARVTAKIAHPNTVPLYEVGRDRNGALYFTMKLLAGQDLRELLTNMAGGNKTVISKFPIMRLADILVQVAQPVAYAHAHGVIHRDLKPANILVGKFGEVILLDWGLAKVSGEKHDDDDNHPALTIRQKAPANKALTTPGARYGTPLYMSPEQARGDSDLDERTDIYNLGIILFEMLTLKELIEDGELNDVLDQIKNKPTPRPSEVAPKRDIPPPIEAICLRALEKNRDDRYQSITALIKDLLHYRHHSHVPLMHPDG
jgi:serine/threonine protein kinase